MLEIFLIRHGQASFGEDVYDRLSATGIEQSRRLGTWLAENNIRFDAVYSGQRERQRDTATLALTAAGIADPDVRILPQFNELDAEKLMKHAVPRMILRDPMLATQMIDAQKRREVFRRLFERIVDEWVRGDWQDANIGNWQAFRKSVLDAVTSLAGTHTGDQRIAVFTSGGPITAVLQSLDASRDSGLDWRIANTSMTRLETDGQSGLRLRDQRVLPHLASLPELITYL